MPSEHVKSGGVLRGRAFDLWLLLALLLGGHVHALGFGPCLRLLQGGCVLLGDLLLEPLRILHLPATGELHQEHVDGASGRDQQREHHALKLNHGNSSLCRAK